MASSKTISIGFKIEDSGNGFKSLILDAKEFEKAMRSNVVAAEKLNHNIVNFGNLAQGIDSLSSTLGSLQSVAKEFVGAYQVQVEAEQRLTQVMRNTMSARDEDVQSIKDLCSAQQKLGIIGDEVQLQGAQVFHLKTPLLLKSSAIIGPRSAMTKKERGASTTPLSRFHYKLYLTKLKP